MGWCLKAKICKWCKQKFTPERQFQTTCSYECAINYTRELQLKKKKKEATKAKAEFKANDKSILKRLAQTLVNKYIRERDKLLPCISCGFNGTSRQWHASHYMPMGNNSAIRFNEDNIHKACSICNNHLSGNLVPYRVALIKKIGEEKVIFLESQKHAKKWSVEELQEIIKTYREKLKEIVCWKWKGI